MRETARFHPRRVHGALRARIQDREFVPCLRRLAVGLGASSPSHAPGDVTLLPSGWFVGGNRSSAHRTLPWARRLPPSRGDTLFVSWIRARRGRRGARGVPAAGWPPAARALVGCRAGDL